VCSWLPCLESESIDTDIVCKQLYCTYSDKGWRGDVRRCGTMIQTLMTGE
jgi:hypothetical protein